MKQRSLLSQPYPCKRTCLILSIILLSLCSTRSMAGSIADSVWLGQQQGTLTYGTPGQVTFKIYVRKSNQGGTGIVNLSATTFGQGISVTLSPTHVEIGGNEDIDSSATLTVTISGTSTVGSSFSVAIQDGGNASISTAFPVALNIAPMPLTPVFTVANKTYDGNTDATITGISLTGTIINGDVVSLGTGGSATFSDKNVGTGKTVTASGFQLTGANAANYYLTAASTTADITKRPITVTADAKVKTFGDADPAFTYEVTSGSLAAGDAFSGALARVAGESAKSPATYAIMQGSLSPGNNYSLEFIGANLTILNIPITGVSTSYNPILCNGSTTAVAAAASGGDGALQYQLSGSKDYPFQSTVNFANVPAGNYTLTVKDEDGYTTTSDFTVSEPSALTAAIINTTNVTGCWGAKNATITAKAQGGTGPYSYTVAGTIGVIETNNSGYFTELLGNLPKPDAKTVSVTDANGCFYQIPEVINLGTGGLIKNVSTTATNVTCSTVGSIIMEYTGGVGSLTYHLDGPIAASNPTGIFTDLAPGTYTISASDTNGCTTKERKVIVRNQANLAIRVFSKQGTSCSLANDGSVTLKAWGGKAPYIFSITGNDFSENALFTSMAGGTYIGTVKDANGCTASVQFKIAASTAPCSVDASLQANASISNVSKLSDGISVQAFPNPSPSIFKVQIQTGSNEKVHLMVTDTYGRVLFDQVGTGDQLYTFGDKFPTGLYMLQVVQGSVAKTIKLIKQ